MHWLWEHRGAIGLIVFVLCVCGAIYQIQESRYRDARAAAILVCEQENFRSVGEARTVEAAKTIANELAKFLKTSATFRHSQGQHKLANDSDQSRAVVLAAQANLIKPRQINCARTYDEKRIIYKDSKK